MRKIHRDALLKLGITVEEYRVDKPSPISDQSLPMACGIALVRNGRDVAVIEQIPRGWDGDGKFRLLSSRSNGDNYDRRNGRAFRTQREALAAWARTQS